MAKLSAAQENAISMLTNEWQIIPHTKVRKNTLDALVEQGKVQRQMLFGVRYYRLKPIYPQTEEELEHAKQHRLLYEHFEELVEDWFDHEEWAKQRGTVLELEAWAHKQSNELDHKRH